MTRTHKQRIQQLLAITILGCSAAIIPLLNNKRNRTIWMQNWLSERREKGEYALLLNQLRLEDAEGFRRYHCMSSDAFAKLMELVGPSITKQRTNMREPVPAEAKLAITPL